MLLMRIACGVAYLGTHYYGWQSQVFDQLPTIQETLEQAISRVANHPVQIVAAGRTDAGVHATGQVIHFDTTAMRTERAWLLGVNSYLPPDIALQWVIPVQENFHARFSALSRCYCYCIYNAPTRMPLWQQRAAWIHTPLNVERMQEAAQALIGEHDFSAFRAAGCQARTAQRCVEWIHIQHKDNAIITLQIQANAFLHHMVRNIMGVLIPIGAGEQPVSWAKAVLQGRERQLAGITAPACGLYLTQVSYPSEVIVIPRSAEPLS